MLTEEQIESYLYRYVKRQEELSVYVTRIILERISDIGALASFDNINSLEQVVRTNTDIQKIRRAVVKNRQEQLFSLEDDFTDLVIFMYAEAKRYYDEQVILEHNLELMEALRKEILAAQSAIWELTKNPVILLRDMKNVGAVKPYTLEDAYKSLVQETAQYKNINGLDINIALNRSKSQLLASGIRFADDSLFNSDTTVTSGPRAVRFGVLENIKDLINTVQDIMGKQFGADGLELSAHIFPAPDHAPAQGHQFTYEEVDKMQSGEDFTDFNGTHYSGFVRNIGQWNCRHYFTRIKLGSEPQYSQEQLDKILAENERGYVTSDGRHYTLYECTQIQRRYERNIRNAKENYLMANVLNDKLAMSKYRNRVGVLTSQYKQFSQACDIPAKLERIKVKYYE